MPADYAFRSHTGLLMHSSCPPSCVTVADIPKPDGRQPLTRQADIANEHSHRSSLRAVRNRLSAGPDTQVRPEADHSNRAVVADSTQERQ